MLFLLILVKRMATYDPSEGRIGKDETRFKINLPPGIKITESTLISSIPEKKYVPEFYTYNDPARKEVI